MDCVKNIGCYPSCNAIKFPYPALETGVHFVVFDWLGTKKTIAFEAVEGEQFYIPNYFNESSDPVFSIKQPSGSYLCWDKELEALAVCPDDCGKDCDLYRHFTLEINQTSGLDGEDIPDYTFSNKVYNIDQAVDNGDGTYTIDVDGAVNGDLAVDDSGTFYEYNDGIWTVKFKEVCAFQDVDTLPDTGEDCALYFQGGKYWAWDGAQFVDVTPIIDFDDIDGLPNLVRSVTGDGVDNTDPQNPVLSFPDADEVDDAGTTNKFVTQAEKDLIGTAIQSTEKGAANGVATLDANALIPTNQIPPYAISELVEAVETSIAAFAANSGNYTFQTGDVILIDDSGNLLHYFYKGGDKTDVSNYSPISATQIDWSNVLNKPTDLQDNLFTKDLVLGANRTHQLNNHEFKITGDVFFLNSIMFQLWDGGFEYRNLYVWDNEIGVSVATTDNKYAGFVARSNGPSDVSLQIRSGQLLNALSSLDVHLKRVDVNGTVEYGQLEIPEYATDTDADNDSALAANAPYAVTGELMVRTKNGGAAPSNAIPEYASKGAAIADPSLGLNYPYSIEGDDTAYVKKDTGFISTWDTTQSGVSASDEIALPLEAAGTYNFDVWYGGQLLKTITTYTDNVISFPDGSGTKQIICVGQLEGFRFANGGDKDKILSVESFGSGFGGTDFSQMFWGCSNLTEVGILDTAGVTSMDYMFRDCTSLTALDVSSWNVSSVTSMNSMFFGCTSLTTLDVSGWDVSSVTSMNNMFYQCTSLTTLDVSGWDVSSVTNMNSMFRLCTSLPDLPIQSWNIENVTNLLSFARDITIPTSTYDQILTNWSAQNVNPNLSPNFGNSKYSAAGQAGRDDLINNHGWTITDGGLAP